MTPNRIVHEAIRVVQDPTRMDKNPLEWLKRMVYNLIRMLYDPIRMVYGPTRIVHDCFRMIHDPLRIVCDAIWDTCGNYRKALPAIKARTKQKALLNGFVASIDQEQQLLVRQWYQVCDGVSYNLVWFFYVPQVFSQLKFYILIFQEYATSILLQEQKLHIFCISAEINIVCSVRLIISLHVVAKFCYDVVVYV